MIGQKKGKMKGIGKGMSGRSGTLPEGYKMKKKERKIRIDKEVGKLNIVYNP